jgi:hypothetical protein
MSTNRREMILMSFRSMLVFAMGLPLMGAAGCDAIVAQIETYLPVALQAFATIVSLVCAACGPLLSIIAIVKAGFADVSTAIADWKAADATQKPGVLGDVTAALQVVVKDLQQFLSDVGISNPADAALAEGLATIIIGVLQFFINKLSPTASVKTVAIINGKAVPTLAITNVKDFKKAFNAKLVALGHPEKQLK